jgi:gamma-glutamylcyclotransferase (GGCT)/AIG2-like uncharacterized protein YtfP
MQPVERVAYFAYGTTQRGFAHHRSLAHLLGEPLGRFATVEPHAVVVPHRAACSNPGCRYVHRMAALVPGLAPLRVAGDVFLIAREALDTLDALELSGPYVRERIAVRAGDDVREAYAYPVREPARWLALVERGAADALAAYPPELAAGEALKACCRRDPTHPGPHEVIDPL